MSTTSQNDLYVGKQETYFKVITEGEAAIFAGLTGDSRSQVVTELSDLKSEVKPLPVSHLFLVGLISGLLNSRFPGEESQCITIQYEFLAPVFCGERIEIVIELIQFDSIKHLITYRADCYNQGKNQVLTGQSVMLVHN